MRSGFRRYIYLLIMGMLFMSISVVHADNWDIEFEVETADTGWTLIAGVRPFATASYNLLWDLPYLGTPLDSAMMWKSYEAITGYPIWLTSDRKNDDGVFWQWDLTVGLLLSLADKTVRWDSPDLPPGEWYIGMDVPLPDWVSMDAVDSFSFDITEGVQIRRYVRPIVDATGPVVKLITPAEGDTGVPINTGIIFEVTDSQSWVDDTTIDVQILDRIPIVTNYPLEFGYHVYVELAMNLPANELIPVIVRAGNVADDIQYTVDTLYFNTSSETEIYSLGGAISLSDDGDPSGAMIDLYADDSLVGTDTVASDGEYFIDNLNSGMYLAVVQKADYHDGGGYVFIYVEGWTRDFVLEPDTGTGVAEGEIKPVEIEIYAYPNPFNSSVRITGQGVCVTPLRIEVFDVNGRRLAVIARPKAAAISSNQGDCFVGQSPPRNDGVTESVWTPDENLGSGVYLIRATVGEEMITKRIVYLK